MTKKQHWGIKPAADLEVALRNGAYRRFLQAAKAGRQPVPGFFT